MITKRFDKKLFAKYDAIGRETIKLHLGPKWHDNPDRYGPDLIHESGKRFTEVEIKRVWKTADFAYDDVQIPHRKHKWRDLNINFYILNNILTHAIKIPGKQLQDKFIRMVPNRFVPAGELFFAIPMTNVSLIKLRNQPITAEDADSVDWQACTRTQPNHCQQMDVPFRIVTRDGIMSGQEGDYLMKDVCGNLYVCKEKVFKKSYKVI